MHTTLLALTSFVDDLVDDNEASATLWYRPSDNTFSVSSLDYSIVGTVKLFRQLGQEIVVLMWADDRKMLLIAVNLRERSALGYTRVYLLGEYNPTDADMEAEGLPFG